MGELERTLTAAEFAEWVAYDELDPIGGYRTDLGFALLAYLQAGDKNKTIHDFLLIDPNPMTEEEKQEFDQRQLEVQARQEVQAMIAMFGGQWLLFCY